MKNNNDWDFWGTFTSLEQALLIIATIVMIGFFYSIISFIH